MEFTLDGKTVRYANGGRDHDSALPGVVMVHGSGMNRTVWQMQTRYLAHHGYRVAAIDLPGHGGARTLCDQVDPEVGPRDRGDGRGRQGLCGRTRRHVGQRVGIVATAESQAQRERNDRAAASHARRRVRPCWPHARAIARIDAAPTPVPIQPVIPQRAAASTHRITPSTPAIPAANIAPPLPEERR